MHDNVALLKKLFTALGRRDHEAIASCYADDAHFRDIAFSLSGKARIHDMWRMICEGGCAIEVGDFGVIEADDCRGRAWVVEHYMFHRRKSRHRVPVDNVISSTFRFRHGRIVGQEDHCDSKEWARQAMGEGLAGFLAGRLRPLRWFFAKRKLAKFVKSRPRSPRT
ncbi:MAG: nuclear transport factor 2 family protein [Allosphingosinicella sp.]